MRVWSYVLLGLLFLGLAGPISAQQNAAPQALVLSREETDWLATHPVVRLGIDPSYGPYSFLDENGQLQGMVGEFLTHIEQTLGLRFEIVSNLDWPRLMEAVQQRRIDAVATVVRLPERDAFLEFTAIYLPTPLVVMTRNDTPQLRSLDELPNLRLTLVEGYSSSKQVMALNPAIRPFFVATPLDGLRAVASGSADAYVGVLGVNTFLASQHGIANLKVNAAFDMADNGQRFGVRKDWPQLAGLLDKALGIMPARQRADIMQRWLPIQASEIRRLSQPTLATRLFPWLLGLFGLAAGAYLIVLLWNHRLKRELARQRQELECLTDDIRQLNAELEERVRQRTAELAAANKELETFTYSVSHDLKAPLRGIDGYSRLLLEGHEAQLDEEGRLFLNNVRHGVGQMVQLIEDLLAYSRMERRSLGTRTVDLARVVAEVIDERRGDIAARGMVVELAGLQGLVARADPEGLAMVLRNLVDNALKFTRDSRPPTLTISGTAAEKSVILEVRDNGIGFDMQFHDRIFEIFQRLQRAEDYPGTGVGLAIVRKAMQRMGGRAWAESRPGQGATFHLELPR